MIGIDINFFMNNVCDGAWCSRFVWLRETPKRDSMARSREAYSKAMDFLWLRDEAGILKEVLHFFILILLLSQETRTCSTTLNEPKARINNSTDHGQGIRAWIKRDSGMPVHMIHLPPKFSFEWSLLYSKDFFL